MIHTVAHVDIHRLAHVEDAFIGAGTRVWQFASVTGGTILGEDCSVSPFAMLHGPRFGDRCIISGGVMMGPGFVFGDDCFIGPNVTMCNDMWPSTDKTGLDLKAMRRGDFVTIRAGNRVTIGANAVVLPGVTLADGAIVAAGAVCGKNVPAGYLFRRDGKMIEVSPAWTKRRRMREAKASC